MMQSKLRSSALLSYGVLAAPIAFAGFPLYVLAPDFYATQHGISLSILGIALLGLRLFDALQDPFIGSCSDRYSHYRTLVMIVSAMVLCASIYGLFVQQYFSPLLWFICFMGLAVTSYSILSINLNALGALWTQDSHQQTRIAATREAFGLAGLLIAVSLPGLLKNLVPSEQVYHWFGLALAVLMGIALFFFLRWHGQAVPVNTNHIQVISTSFFSKIKTLSIDSRHLLLVYLVSMIASSIPAVLVIFFVRDLLGAEPYTGLFLFLYFVSAGLFMPVWQRISVLYGKYRAWLFSMLVAVSSFIWAFTLGAGDVWQYAVICLASGMALGADLVFPPSILADQIHSQQKKDSVFTYYALLTLIAKASLAIASVIALPLLESAGFTPKAANTGFALMGLSIAYALIPCILKCIAAGLLWHKFIRLPA